MFEVSLIPYLLTTTRISVNQTHVYWDTSTSVLTTRIQAINKTEQLFPWWSQEPHLLAGALNLFGLQFTHL